MDAHHVALANHIMIILHWFVSTVEEKRESENNKYCRRRLPSVAIFRVTIFFLASRWIIINWKLVHWEQNTREKKMKNTKIRKTKFTAAAINLICASDLNRIDLCMQWKSKNWIFPMVNNTALACMLRYVHWNFGQTFRAIHRKYPQL